MFLIKRIVLLLIFIFCYQNIDAQWKKVSVGNLAWLHSVYFLNQNKGWIVGSQGTFLETNDGGSTWQPNPTVTKDRIRDVYFADENHGWILAEKDTFASLGNSPSYILETINGGRNWKRVNLENEGKERLVRIFFSKDGFGRAVGETGTFYAMQEDKITWKRIILPVRFLLLNGNFFSQENGLVIGGGGSIFLTEDGGRSWNKASFINQQTKKLNSVFFINQNIGWAVGAEGKILTTLNGGKLWHEQKSNITQDLFDIFFINTGTGWAIGDNGLILQTTTAGNIWTPVELHIKHKLEKLFFINQTGWAVGFGGTVLKYDSGQSDKNAPKSTPILQNRNY